MERAKTSGISGAAFDFFAVRFAHVFALTNLDDTITIGYDFFIGRTIHPLLLIFTELPRAIYN